MEARYMVGLDVGSTTVKAIVAESQSDKIVWQDYQRHETKQPEKVLEFLQRIEAEAGVTPENARAFITGLRAAARGTSKLARTYITPSITSATWFWR